MSLNYMLNAEHDANSVDILIRYILLHDDAGNGSNLIKYIRSTKHKIYKDTFFEKDELTEQVERIEKTRP